MLLRGALSPGSACKGVAKLQVKQAIDAKSLYVIAENALLDKRGRTAGSADDLLLTW